MTKKFTDKQQFILDNLINPNESIAAWARRLNKLRPENTTNGYRAEIRKLRARGYLQMSTNNIPGQRSQNWDLKKVTTHPDGSETVVEGLIGPTVDTKGMEVVGMTTSPNGGGWVRYKKNNNLSEAQIEEVLDKIISKRSSRLKKEKYTKVKATNEKQLWAIITDDHIGLDTNPDGNSLFPYVYNEEVYKEKMSEVFDSIMSERLRWGVFDEFILCGLGDLEDGFDKKTTRGGHDLPQNMSNAEVFDLAVDSRLEMIDKLITNKVAKKITLRIVTNSNHSSSFALIVAKAIKKICDRIYSEKLVEIDILRKFIEHRSYGEHCFIMSHGKDDKQMKSGLPVTLNDKTVNYINGYIDYHELKSKYKYFHVYKGDSHRLGHTSHKNFEYISFPAFCPVSNWIGTNFGDVSRAGYSISVVDKLKEHVCMQHITLSYEKDI